MTGKVTLEKKGRTITFYEKRGLVILLCDFIMPAERFEFELAIRSSFISLVRAMTFDEVNLDIIALKGEAIEIIDMFHNQDWWTYGSTMDEGRR